MTIDAKRGRFVWYDLMTTDEDAAIAFYGKVAGWGTQPFEGGEKPYTMFTVGDSPIGGVMTIDPEQMGDIPPHWMAHISTDDVDTAADRIRELGGQVYQVPTDIPEVGRFAIAADPQGASFGVFAGTAMPDDMRSPRHGDFSWHELQTTDYQAAFDFYADLFGWQKTSDFDMGDGWMYLMYGQNGKEYGGIYDKTEDMPGPPAWLYYIHVSDIDEAANTVKANGGRILNGPMEVPGGDRVAQCMDPQGAVFALHAKG